MVNCTVSFASTLAVQIYSIETLDRAILLNQSRWFGPRVVVPVGRNVATGLISGLGFRLSAGSEILGFLRFDGHPPSGAQPQKDVQNGDHGEEEAPSTQSLLQPTGPLTGHSVSNALPRSPPFSAMETCPRPTSIKRSCNFPRIALLSCKTSPHQTRKLSGHRWQNSRRNPFHPKRNLRSSSCPSSTPSGRRSLPHAKT
jgi:hypothetical protein